MTEHEHCPPITEQGARRVSPGQIMVVINDTATFMSTRAAWLLRNSIDDALTGPGPEIVCEVVEQVRP